MKNCEPGDEITVSAAIGEGYVFVGWRDEEGNIVSEDLEYTFIVEKSITLTTVFEPAAVPITVKLESTD